MSPKSELTPFEALTPGDEFLSRGVPEGGGVVWTKTSHLWAHATWKGVHHKMPMHPTDKVRRNVNQQKNP